MKQTFEKRQALASRVSHVDRVPSRPAGPGSYQLDAAKLIRRGDADWQGNRDGRCHYVNQSYELPSPSKGQSKPTQGQDTSVRPPGLEPANSRVLASRPDFLAAVLRSVRSLWSGFCLRRFRSRSATRSPDAREGHRHPPHAACPARPSTGPCRRVYRGVATLPLRRRHTARSYQSTERSPAAPKRDRQCRACGLLERAQAKPAARDNRYKLVPGGGSGPSM